MVAQEFPPTDERAVIRWSLETSDRNRHLILQGELDILSRTRAQEILDRATADLEERVLIVDLTHLDFMDCTGIHLLRRASSRVDDQDSRMRIRVRKSGAVRRVLDILGPGTDLDTMLEPE